MNYSLKPQARHPHGILERYASLILDYGSDVAQAHLERQRVILVHSAQLVHEHGHVPDRMAGRSVTLMNLPPPVSAKPGIVPGLIP